MHGSQPSAPCSRYPAPEEKVRSIDTGTGAAPPRPTPDARTVIGKICSFDGEQVGWYYFAGTVKGNDGGEYGILIMTFQYTLLRPPSRSSSD
jgi:hypothetical protein